MPCLFVSFLNVDFEPVSPFTLGLFLEIDNLGHIGRQACLWPLCRNALHLGELFPEIPHLPFSCFLLTAVLCFPHKTSFVFPSIT